MTGPTRRKILKTGAAATLMAAAPRVLAQVAAETIESPTDDAVHAMATHVGDELVERWPSILRTRDALVDVLDGAPAARGDVAAQLEQLVLRRLIMR